jgi:hypothetical protein
VRRRLAGTIGLLWAASSPLLGRLQNLLQVVLFLVPRTAAVTLVFVSFALLLPAQRETRSVQPPVESIKSPSAHEPSRAGRHGEPCGKNLDNRLELKPALVGRLQYSDRAHHGHGMLATPSERQTLTKSTSV